MELTFQWCGLGQGQWRLFLIDRHVVCFRFAITNRASVNNPCLYPLCPSTMNLWGKRVCVFYILIDAAKLFPKWIYHYVLLQCCSKSTFYARPIPPPDFTNQKHFINMMDNLSYCLFYISLIILRWSTISYIYWLFAFSSLVNCQFISFLHFSFLFLFCGFMGSLCIFWIEKGRSSGARLPLSEFCLPLPLITVTLGESSDFSAPQFPHLLHDVNNKPYLLGWL